MPQSTVINQQLRLTGLTCADCAAKLEQRIRASAGVEEAKINFMAAKMMVRHHLTPDAIVQLVQDAGYGVVMDDPSRTQPHQSFLHTHHRAVTTIISALLLLIAWGGARMLPQQVTLPMYIAAILVGGLWTIRRGFSALRHGIFDMNALMTIAVVGAGALGDWKEGASVAVLYSISNMLESYTMEKTRHSLRGLMDLAPSDALVRRTEGEVRLPVAELHPDDIVIIAPGEKIAVDGVLVVGKTSVNQAPITGEAMPVAKEVGDEVFAGTLNELGAIEVRVTRCADDTALARIIHLVEEAQGKRAPSQAFIDRFARVYTPLVLIVAVGIATVPSLVFHADWQTWIYRALTMIVIACPCALVISTPVAIVSAIGNAARHGVLIKGGAYLEQAGRLTAMAFDKTGTLTIGRPQVTDVQPVDGITVHQVIALAAAVEQRSTHPLASAILSRARHEQLAVPEAEAHVTMPGLGVQASIDGTPIYVGNRRLFEELGVELGDFANVVTALEDAGKTVMLAGNANGILGAIAAADQIRPCAHQVVDDLHDAGIRHVVMLTGDHRETARHIAGELGVDEVRAELLPADKANAVRELQTRYGALGMVGDGINDAPALATAQLGIAMGVSGTDTALETADIALMSDDLAKLPYTMRLSRKTLGIIQQNIFIALALKTLALIFIFPGWLTLWLAVLADMGASILVTLNGLRLVGGVHDPYAPSAAGTQDCPGNCCCGGHHDEHDEHAHAHSHASQEHSHEHHHHDDKCHEECCGQH